MTTPQELDERFRAAVGALASVVKGTDQHAPVRIGTALTGKLALELFDAQLASRHLDLAARWLRSFGEGFYTIGSAGHEGNAAVAAAVRGSDPALLHYRSGAFYCARANAAGGHEPIRDVLRGIVAATTDPIAGGRHKVFGHPELAIIPTTSTIASHLPRAVGLAYAIEQPRLRQAPRYGQAVTGARRTGPAGFPEDAIVVCSFGDASVNHAVARAAFNTSGWLVHRGARLPVLYVCEDNGLGISVPSPEGWVETTLKALPGVRYRAADGCDLAAAYDAASAMADWVREHRQPAVLHLRMVRLMGHAGADAEVGYRTKADVSADLERDPLVSTAMLLAGAGLLTPPDLLARYDEVGWQVRRVAEEVIAEPKLAQRGRGASAPGAAPAGAGGPGGGRRG